MKGRSWNVETEILICPRIEDGSKALPEMAEAAGQCFYEGCWLQSVFVHRVVRDKSGHLYVLYSIKTMIVRVNP